jgi:hypothetical protein
MPVTRRIVRLSAIAVLLGLLLLPDINIASAAATNTTKVSIVSGIVKPGGVSITIKYDCFPAGYGRYSSFGDVRVAQVRGAFGDKFFRPKCNDKVHTQAVFIRNTNHRFHRGDAAVALFICGFDCRAVSREIRLH